LRITPESISLHMSPFVCHFFNKKARVNERVPPLSVKNIQF
jgi:hypothetical protein